VEGTERERGRREGTGPQERRVGKEGKES